MEKLIKLLVRIHKKINSFIIKLGYVVYRSKYSLANSFRFNGEKILMYGEGEIKIDENSYIGRYSSIQSGLNCKVVIGRNCRISHFVKIYTSTKIPDQDFNLDNLEEYHKDVIIGDCRLQKVHLLELSLEIH